MFEIEGKYNKAKIFANEVEMKLFLKLWIYVIKNGLKDAI